MEQFHEIMGRLFDDEMTRNGLIEQRDGGGPASLSHGQVRQPHERMKSWNNLTKLWNLPNKPAKSWNSLTKSCDYLPTKRAGDKAMKRGYRGGEQITLTVVVKQSNKRT